MATLYSLMDLEKQNAHMEGELKDAKNIIKEYLKWHDRTANGHCNCQQCVDARALLARNKG